MRGDQRRPREGGDVPEPLLGQVRRVDHDAQVVARPHQGATRLGQAWAGIGGVPEQIGTPVPKSLDRLQTRPSERKPAR